jgi:hypothetical protein
MACSYYHIVIVVSIAGAGFMIYRKRRSSVVPEGQESHLTDPTQSYSYVMGQPGPDKFESPQVKDELSFKLENK